MTFVQIGEFDWLPGRQKGSIFVKMFKNLFFFFFFFFFFSVSGVLYS